MRTLKTLLFLVGLIVALASSAQATQITVEQATINGWQNTNTALRLRIYLSKPVVTSNGVQLQFGNVSGQGVFYKSITCSVLANVLTIPQTTLDSLTDAQTGADAKYSAYFFTSSGSQIAQYSGFGSFTVPGCASCPTSTTWAAILTFNTAFIPHIDNLTYSRTQIDAKIAAIEAGGELAAVPFITQAPSDLLTNEQALSLLTAGALVKTSPSGMGMLVVAVAGSDYQSPISATAPLTLVSNVLAMPAATGSVNGYLTSADWTTFNSKQAALGFTPENSANRNAANGYAGLSSGKLTVSQGQEVWSINDLTEYSSVSGSGSTAIRSTITAPASGEALTWNGTNWVNAAVATVTSVAASTNSGFLTIGGSPITTSGTITVNLTTGLTQNLVVATPNGSSGTVSTRALVNNDLPVVDFSHGGTGLSVLGSAYTLVGVNSGATAYTPITLSAGSNITITPSGSSLIIAAAAAGVHNLLSATHSDTTAAAVVRGAMITGQGSGTPTWQIKTVGAANSVFVSDGTDVGWGTVNLASGAAVSGVLATANGGLGLDASATNNGAIPIKNGSGFTIAQVIAGSNITITPGAGTLQIDASGTLGAKWSDLTSPTANLGLSMGANTTTFTWGAATGGGVDMFTFRDGSSNTGTGHLVVIQTQASSAAKVFLLTALGTTNGVEMTSSAVLAPIGTGGITANALVGVSGNGVQVRTSAGNFTSRTHADAAGITWTNGNGVSGDFSAALNLATLVASQTMWDGSQASRTITFNLSGTDPVLTLGSSLFNVSTGTIQQGGVNVVLETRTLTGGTGINAIGDLSVNRTISVDQTFAPTWTGVHTFTPGARNASAASYLTINIPADTNITASTESIGFKTVTATRTWATGALTTQRENVFAAPTYAFNGTSTLTSAATVAITGAPIAGTNATITNRYALWVQDGGVELALANSPSKVGFGPAAQRMVYNPYETDINIGEAVLYFTPTFSRTSGSDFRNVGTMTKPSFGTTTGAEAMFWTAHNVQYGIPTTIPSGTKGPISAYEATIDTSQVNADITTGESGHAFGATILVKGGAPTSGIDLAFTISTVAPSANSGVRGLNMSLTNNIAGGLVYGVFVQQAGSQAATDAYAATGAFVYGMDLKGMTASAGHIRLPNAGALVGRNAADSGDVPLILLNASNEVETGGQLVNKVANAYFQVGSTASGWLFQNIDSDGRIRFFKQGAGEYLAITATGVTSLFKGANVASATTITATGNLFHVTGTTNITSVSGTSIAAGTTITIIFDGILTFTSGSNLKLANNFVTTANDTITLTYDGSNWYEVARSVNN